MNRTCIIVADARHARFFSVEPSDTPRHGMKLVEQLTLTNPDLFDLGPSAAGRPPTETRTHRQAGPGHRMEFERAFGCEIARHAAQLTGQWKEGTVILIAELRMLGLCRAGLRDALNSVVQLKEVAKNYASLTASELRDRLDLTSIVSARPAGA
jgi:protein required for attachment to host cells